MHGHSHYRVKVHLKEELELECPLTSADTTLFDVIFMSWNNFLITVKIFHRYEEQVEVTRTLETDWNTNKDVSGKFKPW